MNNLIFVSGPHGAGKTTLINNLIKRIPNAISPELKTKTPEFYWGGDEKIIEINYLHRLVLKYAQSSFEGYEYFIAAKKNSEKLIIGDRCIYDAHVYSKAAMNYGWISEENIAERLEILQLKELLKPPCIILNPGFAVCQAQLKKRVKETGWIKFRGEDMGYLEAVCDVFAEYKGKKNILYIENGKDIERTIDHLRGKFL